MQTHEAVLEYCAQRAWLTPEQIQGIQTLAATLPGACLTTILAEQELLNASQLEELKTHGAAHPALSPSAAQEPPAGFENPDQLLTYASSIHGASDLFLETDLPISLSVHGDPEHMELATPLLRSLDSFIQSFLTPRQRAELYREFKISYAYAIQSIGRYRISITRSADQFKLHARILPFCAPALHQLGMSAEVLQEITHIQRGIIWLCGAGGSGVSTTLASLLDHNQVERKGRALLYQTFAEYWPETDSWPIISHETSALPSDWTQCIREALHPVIDIVAFDTPLELNAHALAAIFQSVRSGRMVLACVQQPSVIEACQYLIQRFAATQRTHAQALLAEQTSALIVQTWPAATGSESTPSVPRKPHFELYTTTDSNHAALRSGQFEKLEPSCCA